MEPAAASVTLRFTIKTAYAPRQKRACMFMHANDPESPSNHPTWTRVDIPLIVCLKENCLHQELSDAAMKTAK